MRVWIRKHSIGLSLIPVVLMMAVIFCFSAQPGDDSGALSGGITRWLLSLFVRDPDSLPQETLYWLGFLIRKAAHFSEYALLGFFLMLHIHQIDLKIPVKCPWLWAWTVGAAYAVTDEFHQGFVGGRVPAVTDVLIDSAGVATGVALLCLLLWYQIRACNLCKKAL